ncbi:MAG: phenylalanine--tRNA ligase subunit beta, partial [Bacteroidales bacterium]|nr:phenylalanine--tRNA ligase subunit beta [Bacteroidales bacterium]
INNVVDITNYLLHETGQPLHAFDAAKIAGNKIVVRTAPAAKFTTLDGVERELHENDLMICNAQEPMCMAGVFGGLDSGVSESTTSVFLESAYFNPVWVRKTARRHGLNTDSSFRFERGIDPHNTLYVLKRAAMMIKELAGATISSEIIDNYPQAIEDFSVSLSYEKCHSLIGKKIEPEVIKTILEALEIKIVKEENGVLDLLVPAYRVDVQRDCDVIEDILRIYGYNNIEIDAHVKSTLSYTTFPDSNRLKNLISEQLTAAGFREVLNNSLTSVSYYENLETFPVSKAVKVMNALSNDLSLMRQTLLFGGLENIARNRNRRQNDLKFYELGSCYHYDADKREEGKSLAPYSEEAHLALWICGNRRAISWNAAEEKTSIYDLKAYVQNVFARLGIDAYQIEEGQANDLFVHTLTYKNKAGKELAVIGSVHPRILKQFDIDTEVFYADMQWPVLMKAIKNHKVSYTELPKFPEVRRDLALLLDKAQTFSQIEKIALASEKKLLKSVGLFDVYEGKNLPEGKKSYAVYFILQDETQTLTDK